LGDARRRLRLLGGHLDLAVRDGDAARLLGARDERGQLALALVVGGRGEHRAPAGLLERARAGAEALAGDLGHALDALPQRGPVEGAEEAARDEIEEPPVVAGERLGGELPGRDDREVVGDAAVVEDALLVAQPGLAQPRRGRRVVLEAVAARAGAGERLEHARDRRPIVARQAARVGARVGEQLVTLVAALRGRERAARRPAEATVRLALEARQVEERRRALPRRLARFGAPPAAPP